MAVEIIDEKPDPSVLKQVVCKQCRYKLQYLPVDVEVKSYSCMGETDTTSFIKCPKCKNTIYVKSY